MEKCSSTSACHKEFENFSLPRGHVLKPTLSHDGFKTFSCQKQQRPECKKCTRSQDNFLTPPTPRFFADEFYRRIVNNTLGVRSRCDNAAKKQKRRCNNAEKTLCACRHTSGTQAPVVQTPYKPDNPYFQQIQNVGKSLHSPMIYKG